MKLDHILLVGFGGPTRPEEVEAFLQRVTRGTQIPQTRLKEVLHHYEEIGGSSPYNGHAFEILNRLKQRLASGGISIPVFLGMRNWHPFLRDTLVEIKTRNLKKGLGIVLAPQRSDASFERYLRDVEETKASVGAVHVDYQYLKPWHNHPRFIGAQAEEVQRLLDPMSAFERERTFLLFSAHSIPLEMAQKCRYAEEVAESSALVSEKLGHKKWKVAYQSRSGSPTQPWLEPDVLSRLREIKNQGAETALVVPIGFICGNAEILYDLDVEAQGEAERMGIRYLRSPVVQDHPKLIEMFAQLIQENLN